MLAFSAAFEVDGYVRRLDVFSDELRDPSEPLARVGGFIKSQSKKRFDSGGPGWEPLKASTIARKPTAVAIAFFKKNRHGKSASDDVAALGKRLAKSLTMAGSAEAKSAEALTIAGRLSTAKGRRIGAGIAAKADKRRGAALAKAEAIGAELHGLVEQYGNGRAVKASDVAGLVSAAEKEQARRAKHGLARLAARDMPLTEGERRVTVKFKDNKGNERTRQVIVNQSNERRRVGRHGATRYRNSMQSLQLLGSLRNALHLYVDGAAVVVIAGPGWSGVHNKGGTAGNGAKIPKREYLIINSETLAVTVAIFEEYMFTALVT